MSEYEYWGSLQRDRRQNPKTCYHSWHLIGQERFEYDGSGGVNLHWMCPLCNKEVFKYVEPNSKIIS